MNKRTIIDLLSKKYTSFVSYIDELTDEEYLLSDQGKWTAGQQLEHIVLCVKPLVQIFAMDKVAIEQKFGRALKQSRSYESLVETYTQKLKEGGKSPERYLPETNSASQRKNLGKTLLKMIEDFGLKIGTFTEKELDTLCIPYPLVGNLTLREVLYHTIYHVEHHQKLVKQGLKNR